MRAANIRNVCAATGKNCIQIVWILLHMQYHLNITCEGAVSIIDVRWNIDIVHEHEYTYILSMLNEVCTIYICNIIKHSGIIWHNYTSGVCISKGRKCLRCRKYASYLPTTINIYDLEIRSINNYRKIYTIASFLVSTTISRRCRFGNCKYIRSSYVRRKCIYDNNRVSANISSYDYRWFLS